MLIVNDSHLGVTRSGGTTPKSQQALRDYLRESLLRLINTEQEEVTINGDLLDGFTVDTSELIKAYAVLSEWIGEDSADGGKRTMNLIQGNHDSNPRGDKLSSFHVLCHFLRARFPNSVHVFDTGFARITDRVFCIPHMPNQSLFDLEVEKAVGINGTGKYLLCHCNYKNGFAENSDHSLNINDHQVGKLMIGGWTLVLAHEHQGCDLRGGRVIVVGNQYPSSVADCLGNSSKRAMIIDNEGHRFIETWSASDHYGEIDWRTLGEAQVLKSFYRVTGEATANEAAEVINAISKFRQACAPDVFVVTNAVKVEGAAAFDEMAEVGVEGIKAFDVLGAIFEHLDEAEVAKVKELLA